MRVALIVQQAHSNPGRIGRELRRMGCRTEVCRPALGQALPSRPDELAAAVVFGGPMNIDETQEHPALGLEMAWIERALAAEIPLLGVCLGGQMLAKVLGAEVVRHAAGMHEIGYHPVRPAPDGAALFDRELVVYQWHSYGFGLPAGAALLAQGEVFSNQAFRYGRAYAIQFHPEVTASMVARWTVGGADKLTLPGAQSRAEQLLGVRRHEPGIRRWLLGFLHHWLTPPGSPPRIDTGRQPAALSRV